MILFLKDFFNAVCFLAYIWLKLNSIKLVCSLLKRIRRDSNKCSTNLGLPQKQNRCKITINFKINSIHTFKQMMLAKPCTQFRSLHKSTCVVASICNQINKYGWAIVCSIISNIPSDANIFAWTLKGDINTNTSPTHLLCQKRRSWLVILNLLVS